MNNYQECKHLEIKDAWSSLNEDRNDPLSILYDLQKTVQEKVYKTNFDKIRSTVGGVLRYIDWNENAIQDELRELIDATTGIDTYPKHWKPWKAKHKEALNRPFSDLTEGELKELKMEWVDILHFMFNIALAIGLTPQEMFNFYLAKNKENVNRQKRRY